MFSHNNFQENGVRENNVMGGRCFFKTSWPCGFVHMRCTPDSDLKVMQRHVLNCTEILDTIIFYFAFFILNVNHASLENTMSSCILLFSSTDLIFRIFSRFCIFSFMQHSWCRIFFTNVLVTFPWHTSQMDFFVQPNTSHSVAKSTCIEVLLVDCQVLVAWLRLQWW